MSVWVHEIKTPVRMIVPFPPGGPTDLMARLHGQKLAARWDQPVVVENRAGGNSAIGAQQAAKSLTAQNISLLIVRADTGPTTAQELIDRARQILASSITAPERSPRVWQALFFASSQASTWCSFLTRAAPKSCRAF
jgi:tripartite-type tricarboxylate transporter receptor subunit TctC